MACCLLMIIMRQGCRVCVGGVCESVKRSRVGFRLSRGLLVEEDLLCPSGVVAKAVVKGIYGELVGLRSEGEVCKLRDEVVACDFPDVCIDGYGVMVLEGKECDAVGDFPSTAIDFGESTYEVVVFQRGEVCWCDAVCVEVVGSSDDAWCAEAKAIRAQIGFGYTEELLKGWEGMKARC